MSNVASRLPQELVDIVINGLRDDRGSLWATSLVCRRFVAPSQKHLFWRIELRSGPAKTSPAAVGESQSPTELIPAFAELVESSPHLAEYVLKLILSDKQPETELNLRPKSAWLHRMNSESLVAILARLHNLEAFHIQGMRQYCTAWEDLHPNLQTTLMTTFRLGSLSSLSIHWLHNFPLTALRPCSQLKHLDLMLSLDNYSESQFPLETAPGSHTNDAGQPRAQLQSLTLSCSLEVLEWFIRLSSTVFDLAHVRNLAFPGPSNGEVLCNFWKIIQTCSHSLEHLALWPSNSVNAVVPMSDALEKVDLGICHNLHSFDIYLNFDDDFETEVPRPYTPSQTTEWMCELLGKIPHLRGIRKITLRCYTQHYNPSSPLLRDISSLRIVDQFLSGEEYPSLGRVCLLVANAKLFVPGILSTMEGCLPRLCAKGVVRSELIDGGRIAVVF